MKHRGKAALAVFLIVVIGVFLPFYVYSQSGDSFTVRGEQGGLSQQEYGDSAGGLVFQGDCIHTGFETEISGHRQSGPQSGTQRLTAVLWIAAAIAAVISREKVYFLYTQFISYLFARILCEIFTLQEKDGKKRQPAF